MSLVLHVVAVGLSINDGLNGIEVAVPSADRKAVKNALQPDVLRTRGDDQNVVRRTIMDHQRGMAVDLPGLLGAAADAVNRLRGSYRLCAEWTSIHVEADSPPPGDQHDGHAYVLVATDTEPGLRAAALVAAGLPGTPPVQYVDDPGLDDFRGTQITPGHAYLCRVPGLDFTRPEDIDKDALTWRALGSIGHTVAESAANPSPHRWRVVVHLSGGFKALIPYLLVVAEGINSVFGQPDRVSPTAVPSLSAVILHEKSQDKRVAIPVRALKSYLYSQLLRLTKNADPATGTVTGESENALDGLCLDAARGALTTMGKIMVAIP